MHADGTTGSLAERTGRAFAAYRGGDPAAMADLVDATTALLWHTARAQGLGSAAAEDVVQTTWLSLVRHQHSIEDPRAVLKWLLTTARREAWSVSRRSRREDAREEMGDLLDGATVLTDGPEQLAVRGHEQTVLWRHFAALSQRCQELLRVVAQAERPDYQSVAEALGMPVGSIGPTRGRCLAKLRADLTNDPAWEVAS
ncbi:sigma-70 family RNA polymerase sigma factor [Pedococcus sp. KACC 23699]|uniref:Sigma-70 family RNA polymerase sigma factor n=1 Tax=Pedococcus sp. KACC 23699 TaxID=3149228 RepID=A0AAU7JZH2_9MICO